MKSYKRKHVPLFEKWVQQFNQEESINEAFKDKDLNKVLDLVQSYLTKKIGFVSYGQRIENIKQNGTEELFGIRFLTNDPAFFRLNWKQNPERNSSEIVSVDFWIDDLPLDGTPEFKLVTKGANIVQILAKIVNILKEKRQTDNEEDYLDSLLDILESEDEEIEPITEGVGNFTDEERVEFTLLKDKARGKKKDTMNVEDKKRLSYLWLVFQGFRDVGDETFDFEQVNEEENIDPEELRMREEFEKKLSEEIDIQTKFKDMKIILSSLAKGIYNSFIITGTAGIGKTYTVIETMKNLGLEEGVDWVLNKGTASPIGMYKEFYKYRDDVVIVFDDCDSVFRDENGINVLKGALDSSEIRKVSWKTGTTFDPENKTPQEIEKLVDRGKVPNNFELTSRCLFITNLKQDELLNNDKLAALLSRSMFMDMTFSEEEIIDRIREVMPHMHIFGINDETKLEMLELMERAAATGKFKKEINLRTFEQMCKTKVSLDLFETSSEAAGEPVKFSEDDLIRMAVTYS
jgi:hypothetical protein